MDPNAIVNRLHVRKPSLYTRISNAFFGKRQEFIVKPPPSETHLSVAPKNDHHETTIRTRDLLLRTSIGSNAWQSALIAFATYGKQDDLAVPDFEIMREAFAPVEAHPMLTKSRTAEQ